MLSILAESLNDRERNRIADENRLRQLTRGSGHEPKLAKRTDCDPNSAANEMPGRKRQRFVVDWVPEKEGSDGATGEDSDGKVRGFGLSPFADDVAGESVRALASGVGLLAELEHESERQLVSRMKSHALGPWMAAAPGVGLKQGARLLASIGDPYWRPQIINEDESIRPAGPRTVSAMWAYCGLHTKEGVAVKRKRGVQSNWNPTAKMRIHLVATSCVKQLKATCKTGESITIHHIPGCACSRYRRLYDTRRAHARATHADWSDGHSHNDAVRIIGKEILKDMWCEARRLHQKATEVSGKTT